VPLYLKGNKEIFDLKVKKVILDLKVNNEYKVIKVINETKVNNDLLELTEQVLEICLNLLMIVIIKLKIYFRQ